MQEALRQVSSIISGLDRINGIMVEEKTVSVSDEIQEEQVICEENEPEVIIEDETVLSEDEVIANSRHTDISKQLDSALQLISTRIKELDKLAGIVDEDKENLARYDIDED